MMNVGDIRGCINLLNQQGQHTDYCDFVYRRWEKVDPWEATSKDIETMKRDVGYVRQRLNQIIERL